MTPRYFTRRAPKATLYVEDEYYRPDRAPTAAPFVPEHEATDTGLLDHNGDCTMRAPRVMGFIW